MKYTFQSWSPGNVILGTLTVSALVGLAAVIGAFLLNEESTADMSLSPLTAVHSVGEEFTIQVTVHSLVPVNVFAGEVLFDPSLLQITRIDYNTSIADLWAEKPWYENGNGTLSFAGGTTLEGGFTGNGNLLTVTFTTLRPGRASIMINEPRILLHDGLGTDSALKPSIDTIVTVDASNLLSKTESGPMVPLTIYEKPRNRDLNGDGKQSLADMSIFMLYLAQGDTHADFNDDGKVSTADLSLLLNGE